VTGGEEGQRGRGSGGENQGGSREETARSGTGAGSQKPERHASGHRRGRVDPREVSNDGEEPTRSSASWLAYFTIQASPAMGVAWTMTGAVAGCGLLGWLVDLWARTSPVGLLSGLGVGLAVGFYELAKVMFGGDRP